MRNALAHVPSKQRTVVAAMLKTIFAQENKADAEAQWDVIADALSEKQATLGALMDASRDDVLAYMDFSREHWPQIASTNPLERVNREIKRRSDVIGIFPNDGAMTASTILPISSGRWRSNASACGRVTERASGGLR